METRDICIVDDEAQLGALLKEGLEQEGHRVSTFPDGETFLESVEGSAPDLVFLDLTLPGTDGWHIQERILHEESLPETSVIGVTGRSGPSLKATAMQGLGFESVLEKPFTLADLLEATSDVLDPELEP